MRILMVTPFPPVRDGIASYAVQSVTALRRRGHDVEVLSPGPSAAHHHLDLRGPRGGLALAKRVRGYDLVRVQFHPDFFFPLGCGRAARARTALAYTGAFTAANRVEVVVHEIDYRHGREPAVRLMWRCVDRVLVHTERERTDFAAAFGVPLSRVVRTPHGAAFRRHTRFDRAAARHSLGIDPDAVVFLAIGFIQPHKGFDRAVRAFAGLSPRARLDVVGSVRAEDPGYLAYLAELTRLVERTPWASLHTGFVSDELFDRWIVAADVVVLPYRSIWSSGVLERAALYGRPVIATRVGALADQIAGRPGLTLVDDDAGLRAAMWAAAGQPWDTAPEPWPVDAPDPRAAVQAEVIRRAALRRGAPPPPAPSTAAGPPGAVAPVDARGAGGAPVAGPELGALAARLRQVPPVGLPPAPAGGGVRGLAKRVVRRLTAWEVEPVARQVNTVRAALLDVLEQLARSPNTTTGAGGADRSAG